MSLRTGKQIITIQMLRNISRSKDIKAMKMGQFIEYNMGRNFLEKKHAKIESRRLVPDLFLFFKKAFYEVKVSG